ncbi:MAG: HAD family hydrolase, partial [Alistipes shahii]
HRPGDDGRRADGEIHRRNQVFGRRHARRTPHPQGSRRSNLPHRRRARKPCPAGIAATVRTISENGGTPLVVCENERITGVIELQDIIKTGIRERFERLRRMGVKTVMVTGDNPLTAKYIAEKAGVDDFIAEARPEDKLEYIRREQQSRQAEWP